MAKESVVKKTFTKEERQQIVEAFARKHNGLYNPTLFVREVKETGKSHPAWDWFEWDTKKAAAEYNLWQARAFAKDLRIRFEIEEVGRKGEVAVRTIEMPLVQSPVDGRRDGGGYRLVDPNDPAHMAEHCHQAAAALRSWLNRYHGAVVHASCGVKAVEQIAERLEAVKTPTAEQTAA
ncbi:hypothetical protein [Bradyrhizobium uaiense]|uniref:Uncharacterized protein n=1 Tax=Bradyrhizobium uaiense TaxID=2594946 RepID=A0A6P1B972_9BRAD|nr:hypothetical protein [Bradyrhizobium uaiense]NEU94824.1 hypothetical protein [Bradyrhizobium uaiense]